MQISTVATETFFASATRRLTLRLSHSIRASWIKANIFKDYAFYHCNKKINTFYSHTDAREPYLVISASALPSVCESPKFKYWDWVCPVRLFGNEKQKMSESIITQCQWTWFSHSDLPGSFNTMRCFLWINIWTLKIMDGSSIDVECFEKKVQIKMMDLKLKKKKRQKWCIPVVHLELYQPKATYMI